MAIAASDVGLYGLMAEFEDGEALLRAARAAREQGYRRMEAYTPFPVEGLPEVLSVRGRRLPLIVLGGGLVGGATGLLLQWYAAAVNYPFNVGGRPHASWPAFIPVTFELTILVAALSAVLGMFALNGLPQPYHPVFNVAEFSAASRDRFFLCIEATDPRFDLQETRAFLETLGARGVFEVEP
ncbi:DUF3341 domain-containing protein [Litorilinea aerophila]|nr:DUF3341 domain-containing protein [Litorilinea aerophila]MCC9075311.1 DUF3341 domain-containing protein [Litorilinea aerophila]